METDKNYFLVGLFVTALIIVGLGFTLWLTSAGKGNYVHYRVRFAESVSGLDDKSAVKFRGVDVGSVETIAIDPADSKLIDVGIQVLDTTPVKTDTTATLALRGITGDVYVELDGGSPDAPSLAPKAENGQTPEIPAEPSSINAIINGVPELLKKANHIADQIDKIFSDQNVKAVNGVVHNLSHKYGEKDKDTSQESGSSGQ